MRGVQSRDIVGEEYTKGVNILHLAVDNLAERCTAYILGWPNVRTGCPRPEFPMENCTAVLTRLVDMSQPAPWATQAFTNILRMILGFHKTDINHFSIGYTVLHRCMMRGSPLALTLLLESTEINVNAIIPVSYTHLTLPTILLV